MPALASHAIRRLTFLRHSAFGIRHSALLPLLAALLNFTPQADAALANAWHIPDGDSNFGGLNMRNPEFEIGTNTTVTIWSGVYKWGNSGNALVCNQTGGWVF